MRKRVQSRHFKQIKGHFCHYDLILFYPKQILYLYIYIYIFFHHRIRRLRSTRSSNSQLLTSRNPPVFMSRHFPFPNTKTPAASCYLSCSQCAVRTSCANHLRVVSKSVLHFTCSLATKGAHQRPRCPLVPFPYLFVSFFFPPISSPSLISCLKYTHLSVSLSHTHAHTPLLSLSASLCFCLCITHPQLLRWSAL
jgi:hypothetical protein